MKVGISVETIFDAIHANTFETLISEIEKLIKGGYEISVYNQSDKDESFSSIDDLNLYIERIAHRIRP